jgi:tRNA A37 N6-isopentenylltransferase MiaA
LRFWSDRHGKSVLGIAIAERFDGEIINCDSTAVYRGFDIGTDKVPLDERRGIPTPPDRHRRADRRIHRRASRVMRPR